MARGHGWWYDHCRPTHGTATGGGPNVQLISSVAEFGGFWISGFATTKVLVLLILVLLNHAAIHLYEMHK